ncbi:MAG: VPLPA-CTERM-specific exosortase XrtD [Deltaproteobacteria bacterium]|nr:VPLPA-CTERM-specific exosortase XrtD [Deltaproteobacteria bacterium]
MKTGYNKMALAGTGFYVLLAAGIFFNTFTYLVPQWQRDDFTYCYLVPFIVIYLIWEKKDQFFAVASRASWKGMPVLCLGIIFFWIGELGGEYFTLYLSFWLVVVGLCWLHLGWRKLKIISFPLVLILTIFPPPNFIYQKISVTLKLISSQLGVAVMQLFGMSAYREGNVIDLGFTQLQVVDACSGLRYLFPLMVLGILLVYFYKEAFWKKVLVVISTVPISILVNGLRIASVGMLYPVFGPKVASGFFHDFSGWFIFMVSLGILLFEMWVLKKIYPQMSAGHKEQGAGAEAGAGITQNPKPKTRNLLFQPQFVAAVILLGATWGLSQGIEFREKVPIAKSFDQFPVKIGEWNGTRGIMEQKFIDALDLSDYVLVDYLNQKGRSVNFYVAYYESQRKGESIHSPATCMPGGGWIFKQDGAVKLPFKLKDKGLMPVNRALMEKSGTRQLTYYWFPQRGRILTNAYQLKIYAFWDALTRQRTDGALVRVMTPVYEFEELENAEKRLQGFVKEIVPALEEYLPQ